MNFEIRSPEVAYPTGPLVCVDRDAIAALQARAQESALRKSRLCTHPGEGDRLQEMIIAHDRGTYVRPHKHLGKSESFHLIAGMLDVLIFDDEGAIDGVVPMGDFASGRTFFYRLSEPRFHTLIVRSDWVFFHEVAPGPFLREETVFAPWSPDPADVPRVRELLASIDRQARNWLGRLD